jgi:hypothetical protein
MHSSIWAQEWKTGDQVGLDDQFIEVWENYTRSLKNAHIHITEKEDELVWQNSPFGEYTPKLGYTQLMIDLHNQEPVWWWKGLWKIKCPLKAHIFMWCLIKNKIPTWDRIKNRMIEGPGWCPLCKGDEETGVHLFLLCPFVRQFGKSAHGCWDKCVNGKGIQWKKLGKIGLPNL